jgi:hypothetical protein
MLGLPGGRSATWGSGVRVRAHLTMLAGMTITIVAAPGLSAG